MHFYITANVTLLNLILYIIYYYYYLCYSYLFFCLHVAEDTCFEGNGESYRGTISTTISGLQCQPWSDQIFYRTADYPELVGGHSYCRNPGGKESQPWCFTTSPSVRKEICNVPQCGKIIFSNYFNVSKFFALFLITSNKMYDCRHSMTLKIIKIQIIVNILHIFILLFNPNSY